ncbi:hypothetical protein OUZ56_019207 [Daphnia magna]|uniref:Uncharacterized protein n=1 Tax=Daphnia magna TaxID=35525 RepID=A0ABQ9ZAY8_9CRUS|nr:hypothetical protein OUZ56_019207 [Daphnia magna]
MKMGGNGYGSIKFDFSFFSISFREYHLLFSDKKENERDVDQKRYGEPLAKMATSLFFNWKNR